MWKVYVDIVLRVVRSLFSAIYGTEALVGVAIYIAGAYDPRLSVWVEKHTGLGDWWMWVPITVVMLHLIFKAVHDRNVDWEKAQNERIEQIGKQADALAVAKFEARRRDLEDLKKQLYRHLDEPPFLQPFPLGVAQGWAAEVSVILKANVKEKVIKTLPSHLSISGLSGLRQWIAIARAITTGLREDDLRR